MANVAITHAFSPAQADGGDATKVRPSDWKANHDVRSGDHRYVLTRHTGESDGARWRTDRHAVQTMRGMHLRTHPDADKAASQVMLVRADELVLSDGERISVTSPLTANITASGAGGLDTGSEAISEWYEVYLIRNPSTATAALLFHLGTKHIASATHPNSGIHEALRDSATRLKLAQSFKTNDQGQVEHVLLGQVQKIGSPSGNVWMTIEADASGAPSGIALATSDYVPTAAMGASFDSGLIFVFRSPAVLLPRQTYWIVLQGDYAISAVNYLNWSGHNSLLYPDGQAALWNGSAWVTPPSVLDFRFSVYVTRSAAALAMPSGYTQYIKLGQGYNNSSGNLRAFVARDRRVAVFTPDTLSGSPNILTATLPPGSLRVRLTGTYNVAAAINIGIGGVPDGYPASTVITAPVQTANVLLASMSANTNQAIDLGVLATRYQALYFSGTALAWPTEYQW